MMHLVFANNRPLRPSPSAPRPKCFLLLAILLHPILHNDNAVGAATPFNLNLLNPSSPRHHRSSKRRAAIERLKTLVPPPSSRDDFCGSGEDAFDDDAAYARFLSAYDWDPEKAAPMMGKSMEWRRRVRPGTLRPRHCDTLCRQGAWVALLAGDDASFDDGENNNGNKGGGGGPRMPLDTPHNCPPLRSWRTTRHGLPVTYFRCWMWRPDLASGPEEVERHVAYHMHHLIRRMRGRVERMCVVFDMRGFEGWMLPYIHQSINVLRQHYPGRAGAMCFINVPGYFHAVWKVISPWLDDEIRSKTFFAPRGADDVDSGIEYLNGMNLKTGPA